MAKYQQIRQNTSKTRQNTRKTFERGGWDKLVQRRWPIKVLGSIIGKVRKKTRRRERKEDNGFERGQEETIAGAYEKAVKFGEQSSKKMYSSNSVCEILGQVRNTPWLWVTSRNWVMALVWWAKHETIAQGSSFKVLVGPSIFFLRTQRIDEAIKSLVHLVVDWKCKLSSGTSRRKDSRLIPAL